MNTLSAMKTAEANVIAALNGAAIAIEDLGRTELDKAVARLRAAAAGAQVRLAGALSELNAIAGELTQTMENVATDVFEDLSTEPFIPADVWASSPVAVPPEPSVNGTSHTSATPIAAVPVISSTSPAQDPSGNFTDTIGENAPTSHSDPEPTLFPAPQTVVQPAEPLVATVAACPPIGDASTSQSIPTGSAEATVGAEQDAPGPAAKARRRKGVRAGG